MALGGAVSKQEEVRNLALFVLETVARPNFHKAHFFGKGSLRNPYSSKTSDPLTRFYEDYSSL